MEIHPTEMSRGVNGYQEVIERLASEMREGAHKAKSLSSACIYRVPRELRELNESAYTPRLIAIGPLHRNDQHLQTPMQHVKMSYMNNLLCRMTQGMENQEAEQKKILQECVAAMEMSIDDAKKCYAEEVTLDVKMMLVDGCFILEFLYKLYIDSIGYPQFKKQGADPIFDNPSTWNAVQHDLVLLENQIPFLVLKRLYPLTLARISNQHVKTLSLSDYVFLPQVDDDMRPMGGNSSNSGSAKSSCWPCDCVLWISRNKMNNSEHEEDVSSPGNANYHHILHKIHEHFLPPHQTGEEGLRQYMPSASELHYAGVKFVRGTGNNLFKVKFTEPEGPFGWFLRARFEIPTLKIVDTTEPFLRNFIAFEQCPGISQHFTSYALLMDMLVKSDKDVQVLEKAGVVDNLLGASKVVTDLFNNLCEGVAIQEFLFAEICNIATRYTKRSQAKATAAKNISDLKRLYFSSPWKFIGLCAAILYFGIAIAQLIVSIYIK